MLARPNRLRRSGDFTEVMRRGAGHGRGASRSVVVHVALEHTVPPACPGPRVGFAVSKAVGSAVTRNLVRRRLRALTRARLTGWPAGADVVVRALPAAATATVDQLGSDLDRAWSHAYRQVAR
ncbi:ribonuclease P protein component [Motilibacter peucedani]|uniref:Ribonuclease P protein component n=1 Tax=Motilibacter peucedani TaxID=598650 RepID=A0A420XUC8_9ACTN|nr:ribonuclease P protein component [Motilibacter peucedani]RKS80360.1 ribonuclease P protein component [Motilibacter peucedani]